MFSHILVPIDGSKTSMAALDQAIAMARAFSSAVTVVYVIDPYPFTGVGPEFNYGQEQYENAARAEGHLALDAAAKHLKASGITPDLHVVEAHAIWRGIIDTIDSTQVDLVVMGSHGRRGLERLVLGSVTQSVLARTKVDTLVVRSPAPVAAAPAAAPKPA